MAAVFFWSCFYFNFNTGVIFFLFFYWFIYITVIAFDADFLAGVNIPACLFTSKKEVFSLMLAALSA